MKKVIVLICCLVLVGCKNKEMVSYDKEIILDYKVSSDNLSFTSNGSDYKLYKEDELISKGKVLDNNNISNLESDTTYKLIVDDSEEIIKTKSIITIRFGGDVMMSSYFKTYIDMYGTSYMWEDVSDLISSAHYSIFNLETSVSLRGSDTKPTGYGFRSEPSTLKGLVDAGIDMVSLANNHVMDYGRDALEDTLCNISKNGIEYVGAGINLNEASKINYQTINDIKFAFIGASEILGYDTNKATNDKSGVFYLDSKDLSYLEGKIQEAKENAQYVILILHWDREYENFPEEKTVNMAHTLIDSGADIIIGHHPHVLQGIEYYNKGIIYYSTGNFNFLIKNENASQSALFELNLDNEKIVSSKVYPTKINGCKANLLDSSSATYQMIINNLNERSKNFNTLVEKDGNIKKKLD